jgi:hypothetical protein
MTSRTKGTPGGPASGVASRTLLRTRPSPAGDATEDAPRSDAMSRTSALPLAPLHGGPEPGLRERPEAPRLPAVDGPFVEVAPGTWVRARAVLAVEPFPDDDPDGPAGGPGRFAGVVVAGGGGDPVWWRSPHAPAQLRAALRRAEEGERASRLEALARLAVG